MKNVLLIIQHDWSLQNDINNNKEMEKPGTYF